MLRHSFVPSSFQFGIILPIPKDKHDDLSNLHMYSVITLTPAISRLFESVLLAKYGNVLCIVIVYSTVKRKTAAVHMRYLI